MLTVVRNGRLYTPDDRGIADILICSGSVICMNQNLQVPADLVTEEVDVAGKFVTPGFVDIHVHVTGGGGEGGPASRVPELQLSDIVSSGITSVVGLLGTDDVTRHPETLLAKTLALRKEGISAWMLTGSYQFPQTTVTGSVRKDIALIPPVLGVGEVALSDHRSSQPSYQQFVSLVAEARVGGLLGGKCGLVHVHMGGGERGMEYIFRMLKETEIPAGQVLPTHTGRSGVLLEQGIQLMELGGNIDLSAPGARSGSGDGLIPALERLRGAGSDLGRVTVSSDAGGSIPRFDSRGALNGMDVAGTTDLLVEYQRLVTCGEFDVCEVLPLFTSNPASRMGVEICGCLKEGTQADLLVFNEDWTIDRVYSRGKLMVRDGRPVAAGTFERL